MTKIRYCAYAVEAAKITFFCLFVTGLLKLFGASHRTLLMAFNMAVMSCAATFSIEQRPLSYVIFGSSVIVLSILCSGLIGYYFPLLSSLFTMIYIGLAFYLPSANFKNIFINSSVMVVIFTAFAFDLSQAIDNLIAGIVVVVSMAYLWFIQKKQRISTQVESKNNFHATVTVLLALMVAAVIDGALKPYYSHTYWIALTIVVIVQATPLETDRVSYSRIIVNIIGALMAILLFGSLFPEQFWINFAFLSLILYLIFFLSFSNAARTLCIELFVLGVAHLFTPLHTYLAYERILFTLIGGLIVMIMNSVTRLIVKGHV